MSEEKQKKEQDDKKKTQSKADEYMQSLIDKRKKALKAIYILCIILAIVLIFSTTFGLVIKGNNKILKNVSIQNINVGNQTKQQAVNILNEKYEKLRQETVECTSVNYKKEIKIEDIELDVKTEKSVEQAFLIGRNSNLLKNNYKVLSMMFSKHNIPVEFEYNRDKLAGIIDEINKELPSKPTTYSYKIDKDKVTIKKGKPGFQIDEEEFKKVFFESILNETRKVEIPLKQAQPDEVDIEKINKEVYKKQDIFLKRDGREFAISTEEIKKILSQDQEEYVIPLKIKKVQKEIERINANRKEIIKKAEFKDTISKISTYYDGKDKNRVHNLNLLTRELNGYVLLPGEVLSFNDFGDTTAVKGYKIGKGFANGKSVPMRGGGVCQLSSAVYVASIKANMQILERYNHACPVEYMQPGQDATLAYPICDLKIKNTRKTPVKIVATMGNGVHQVTILGKKEKNEPEIRLSSKVSNVVSHKTIKTRDKSLKKGEEVVDSQGMDGHIATVFKEVYINGILQSKTQISRDRYKPLDTYIRYN